MVCTTLCAQALGLLFNTVNGTPVNAAPQVLHLFARAHQAQVFFSYGSKRWDAVAPFLTQAGANVTRVRKWESGTTRIGGAILMLSSLVHISPGLTAYVSHLRGRETNGYKLQSEETKALEVTTRRHTH